MSSHYDHNDDEALARALQEEYDREARSNGRSDTANNGYRSTSSLRYDDVSPATNNPNSFRYTLPPPTNPELVPSGRDVAGDEEYARSLAQDEAARFRESDSTYQNDVQFTTDFDDDGFPPNPERPKNSITFQENGNSSFNDAPFGTHHEQQTGEDDAAYAKRLQQEPRTK